MARRISQIASLAILLYGLWQIVERSYTSFGSILAPLLVFGGCAVLLGSYEIAKYLQTPLITRFFRVRPFNEGRILSGHVTATVNGSGIAHLATERTYVFDKLPQPVNLVDTLYSHPGFGRHPDISEFYSSEDSDVCGVRKVKGDRLLVRWIPKTENPIRRLQPYVHRFTWVPPGDLAEAVNFFMFARFYPTGKVSGLFKTAIPVEHLWAVRKPRRWRPADQQWQRDLLGSEHTEGVPQPERLSDTSFKWEMPDPPCTIVVFWTHSEEDLAKQANWRLQPPGLPVTADC